NMHRRGSKREPMWRIYRKHYRWLRHIPRRKHLKRGILHRIIGDKLFSPDRWKPDRRAIAGGLSLGLFVGLTPSMGVQVLLAGVAAYVMRVNIPLALAGTLITNPFTAALIYPLEYQLGLFLVGPPEAAELEGYEGSLRAFLRYARPLWVGSFVCASVVAIATYGLVSLIWIGAKHASRPRS
ncbi:MAG TPA: DUF2062 domain-containing protein, partial [Chthoniobacterales bacterium]|nr:DUF2062 domain-containing protein [Chthoniobacterales bacterium]